MSKFKGTKGPWIHRQFIDGQNSVRTVDDTRKICVPRVNNREESDANMLLISKAPEMLEMLDRVLNSVDWSYSAWGSHKGNDLGDKIKQLIKEATEI